MASQITAASSADVIGSIDDLLMRILSRLPVKSLMRFKLVSKHWKSLITSRHFSLLHYPGPNPAAVGLFYIGRKISEFRYIHFDATSPPPLPPFEKLRFPGETSSYWIHQSCNGLLLCCSTGLGWGNDWFVRNRSHIRSCYVYNPTTKCFTKLPRPGVVDEVPRFVLGVNLAFDHDLYKVVCVRGSGLAPDLLQIEIYSAESGEWRVSGEPFSSKASFKHGVYWNGSIHWISYADCSENPRLEQPRHPLGNWLQGAARRPPPELLYFHVNKERFGKNLFPAELSNYETIIRYFGESCGHLHIVGSGDTHIAFNVYELKRDYSEWFVKYRVDLTIVVAAFPHMAYLEELTYRICYDFYVFSLIRDVEEQDSFLVLRLSGRIVRFNLDCNTLEEIAEFRDGLDGKSLPHAFEFIESIASV